MVVMYVYGKEFEKLQISFAYFHEKNVTSGQNFRILEKSIDLKKKFLQLKNDIYLWPK